MDSIINSHVETAQISSNEAFRIFGPCKTMHVGRKNVSTFYRMLFKFPITMIPDHCIISKALLKIYVQYAARNNTSLYTPFALTEDWSVSTVNWDNQPLFDPSTPGETKSMTTGGFYTFNITDMVSKWYDHGIENYGLILKNEEIQDMTYNQIITVENPISSPTVEITYTPITPIPTTRFIEDITEMDTSDSWRFSDTVNASLTKTITCHVENLGSTPVEVRFQSSPDDINFVCDCFQGKILLPSEMVWLTPYSFAKYGRVAVKNINAGETSRIKIWYQAQE
ncbi:DNRLRE domain-containing protein [Lutibacter sp. B2]|nr:DNRLRE domain-containing protein [Lutibacter sp. B2]